MENMIFRSINFVIEESIWEIQRNNPGMLLILFGSLSHASILDYSIFYIMRRFEWYGFMYSRHEGFYPIIIITYV
jgi:hypothetical protein